MITFSQFSHLPFSYIGAICCGFPGTLTYSPQYGFPRPHLRLYTQGWVSRARSQDGWVSAPAQDENPLFFWLLCCCNMLAQTWWLEDHPPSPSSVGESPTPLLSGDAFLLETGGGSVSRPTQVGRIQVRVVVKPRSPFPCWLSARGFLSFHIPWLMTPSPSKPAMAGRIPSLQVSLTSPSASSLLL